MRHYPTRDPLPDEQVPRGVKHDHLPLEMGPHPSRLEAPPAAYPSASNYRACACCGDDYEFDEMPWTEATPPAPLDDVTQDGEWVCDYCHMAYGD